MLIATYVNYNRLDFAFTLVRHLIALQQPHYLVGALDDEAGRPRRSRRRVLASQPALESATYSTALKCIHTVF